MNFNSEIRKVIEISGNLNLLRSVGSPVSLNPPSEFKKLTLNSRDYRSVYEAAVNDSIFNLSTMDGAFFQFSGDSSTGYLRLAYYPSPITVAADGTSLQEIQEWLDRKEISQLEFEQWLAEIERSMTAVPIRYDFSVSQYCPKFHPAAHLHIGFLKENRWPVSRILTPSAFFYMILFNCYPDIWSRLENASPGVLENKYFDAAKQCESLPTEILTALEQGRILLS